MTSDTNRPSEGMGHAIAEQVTLANCNNEQLRKIQKHLHPATDRRTLIFAAGALGNEILSKDLGSMEMAQLYDGMVAAGLLEKNPYWPRYAEEGAGV